MTIRTEQYVECDSLAGISQCWRFHSEKRRRVGDESGALLAGWHRVERVGDLRRGIERDGSIKRVFHVCPECARAADEAVAARRTMALRNRSETEQNPRQQRAI